MSDRAEFRPRGPAPLQQGDAAEVDDAPKADARLDRLLGDQELLLRLQLSGYAEAEWEPVAQEFARYGLGVLQAWIGTGHIFGAVLAMTGYRLAPPLDALNDDDAYDLAADTVVTSLRAFLDVLKSKKWDPTRGASLKTYFIGQCMWQFPNIYKRWWRERAKWSAVVLDSDDTVLDMHAGAAPPPDQAVVAREEASEALALVSKESARQAFVLQELGYSFDEIADELGLADAKAVENLVGYQRRRIQERRRKAQ